MSLRGSIVAAALGMAASLIATAPAAAAPTWLASTRLSASGQSAQAPQVSVDAGGDALAVWQRLDETSGKVVVEASGRLAGSASWQSPVIVSSPEDEASSPQVALDSRGDAVLVWLSSSGGEYSIEAASRTGLTGAWQAPVALGALGPTIVMEPRPDLAVDAQGEAVAVWQRVNGAEILVEAAGRPAGGSWLAPEVLSDEAEGLHPAEVGIDAAGDATAVWERKGASVLTVAASRPAGGKWQSSVDLSAEGAAANEPRVAVDAQGDVVAVWERFGETEEIIEAASRPASSVAWGKPVALTKPEGGKGEPANQQLAIDAHGDAVVVWSRFDAAAHDVVEAAAGLASTSAWRAPVTLSAPGATVEEKPQVALGGNGDAVVVWERSNGSHEVVEAASGSAASGSWQAPVQLSAEGEEAHEQQVALDAQGDAASVWTRLDGKGAYLAEAAGHDAAGPLLSSLAIPATGTVGQSLSFATSPFDVWSALGATSWSFGDGTSQTGTNVAHAYGAAGTYTVTVTAADVLGNATTASATVSVMGAGIQKQLPPAVAPKITSARLTHQRFRVASRATAISAKRAAPRGTSFQFTLSRDAELRIAIERSVGGLRSGTRCLAPSAALRRRHAKRCTRLLGAGTLTRANEPEGRDSVGFSGRLGARALPPGAYEAVLTAHAGGLSSAAVTLSMNIAH